MEKEEKLEEEMKRIVLRGGEGNEKGLESWAERVAISRRRQGRDGADHLLHAPPTPSRTPHVERQTSLSDCSAVGSQTPASHSERNMAGSWTQQNGCLRVILYGSEFDSRMTTNSHQN
jgi:hypothetical protein